MAAADGAAGETLTATLAMEARLEGEADSANVIAELRGRETPDEVVVIGGHFDSWDVGQGAHDDGCSMHGRLAGAHDPEGAWACGRAARCASCS